MKPDVAMRQAKKAVFEDGAKFITQNSSSSTILALSAFATKNNVISVSMRSAADQITGSEFTPNVFRTCLSASMHSGALAHYFASKPYKKYFIICQDYAFGHSCADAFERAIKELRPDTTIVGKIFHPIFTKDFAPYITKIIASGAEVVMTSNWGPDLLGLIRHARDLGMKAVIGNFYLEDTVYLNELRENAIGCVTVDCYMSTVNTRKNREYKQSWEAWYKKRYPKDKIFLAPGARGIDVNSYYFLAEAIKKAGSVEAEKVIKAWEGLSFDGLCGKVTMRACDHQIQTPAFVATIVADHSLRDTYDFPFIGEATTIPAAKICVPPEKTGNPRCQ